MEVGPQRRRRAPRPSRPPTRKLIFETVLSDDKAKFERGKAKLSDEAKAAIDEMVGAAEVARSRPSGWRSKATPTTPATPTYNEQLGLARAEAVKRYLYEQHQVPLHKMNAISFGEEKPVMDNKTRDNRSQNRRVVIKVLA